jgi:hypothetical protein
MSLITFVAAVLLMAGTQGCYTQFSAAREEPVYNDDANEAVAQADTEEGAAEEGEYAEEQAQPQSDYGQDWNCQMRFGFDYYYPSTYWPSVGFTIAYNDPWYGWYDPWYSYGYPYYGYGYPYYGYGYPYYPYYPYDPYYGYPGYWYPTEVVPWQNREFGSTRGSGNTRGARGVNAASTDPRGVNASNGSRGIITDPLQQMDLPAGSGRAVTGGTAAGKRNTSSATTAKPSRSNGSSRKAVTRKVEQGTQSARTNQRLYRDRSGVSGSGRSKSSDSSPSVQPQSPPSGGSSRGTSTRPSGTSNPPRSSGSSVRSAPSSAPSPAGRSGGSAPSGGGARSGGGGGGGSRGGGGRR